MNPTHRSKWLNLAISAVIAGALTVFFLTRDHSRFTTLDSRFILFILAWGITIIASPIILVLRIIRMIPDRGSFLYIFTGTINCFIGLYGLFELFRMGWKADLSQEALFLSANIVMAAFIYIDVLVHEIPGLPLRKKTIHHPGVQ